MIYNEFRPTTFKMVKGQKENKQILLNQLRENNPSHAYAFVGLHGSGKTTCAKIFAKSLNCLNPINGEPCNECDSCKEFNKNINRDVFEIDAASNNKVEDVAKIKETIMYPPQRKYKVFILDEAHMLSKAAWNSLLTTIEEAPEKVIFIFCSTELNKFPSTILSRCMTLTFSNISRKEIVENLEYVSKEKNFAYNKNGLELIASVSNGSMRDALSSLEKCVSYGDLTSKNVADTLGLVDQSNVFSIIKELTTNNIEEMLNKVEELNNLGKDMFELSKEILESLRDISVYSLTKNEKIISKDLSYVSAFDIEQSQVQKAVTRMYELLETIKTTDNRKVILDIALMELSTLFSNVKVKDFISSLDMKEDNNKEEVIVPHNVSSNKEKVEETKKEVQEETTKESSKINHFDYLPMVAYLLKSYDVNDVDLEILLSTKIFTKHNTFVVKGKDIEKLNRKKLVETLRELCKAHVSVTFQTVK